MAENSKILDKAAALTAAKPSTSPPVTVLRLSKRAGITIPHAATIVELQGLGPREARR